MIRRSCLIMTLLYGGVFMYSRPEQLLEKYPLTVKTFFKGRECYLCDTSLGLMALHEYCGSKDRAEHLAKMLAHLKQHQILVEGIISSSEGEILVENEEERNFILTESYRGIECDTKKKEDMIIAVELLAKLHIAANEFPEEIPEILKRNQNSLLNQCEKHNRELRQVKNYIRSKKKKNTFELLFTNTFDTFYEKAVAVTEALRMIESEELIYGFCHGDYNQHSIIFGKQGVALVGLEHFTYDLQIRDLANFVRKMMEKNNWDINLGMELIKTYVQIRPLQMSEWKYLYFSLAYPEKFWKLANRYNNAPKSWLSERNVEKLEKVIQQERYRTEFLEKVKACIPLFNLEGIGYT